MGKMMKKHRGILLLALLLLVTVATGCQQQTTASTATATTEAVVYSGVLRADYADALDVTSQLALGILRLEDTADAVTAEQAAQTLPLWRMLQGGTLKTQAEKWAMTKQIESALTEAQVAAIAALQLTEADAQTWLQEQGPVGRAQGGQMPGGMNASGQGNAPAMSDTDRQTMRQRFENMTEEERAQMRAQFGQGGGRPSSGGNAPTGGFGGTLPGVSTMLTRAVITLLTERSGQAAGAAPQPGAEQAVAAEPTATALPVATVTPTPEVGISVPIITLVPWRTPASVVTVTPTLTTTPAATNASANTPTKASTSATVQAQATTKIQGALVQKPDTDPGPPLTIEVTTNTAEPNPLLEGTLIYRVAGFVHNPTEETYALTAVHVTFFDADGFRGAFYPFPNNRGGKPGGEYITHGRMQAEFGCSLLGPGESCPFVAELAGQNMASFLVHPDAVVAEWHESVGVMLSDTKIVDTGTNYVRISGTATNPNAYAIKNVTISALLLDDSGQIVSMGTGVVTSLEAGAATNFEVYVAKKAYTTYQLHARAEQSVN